MTEINVSQQKRKRGQLQRPKITKGLSSMLLEAQKERRRSMVLQGTQLSAL